MNQYVPSVEQLVTEIVVADCKRSADFYRCLGFKLLREAGDFVELTWENHRFYLAEPSAFHDAQVTISLSPPAFPVASRDGTDPRRAPIVPSNAGHGVPPHRSDR